MANKIQLRRDTTDNWERVNPVLSAGEPALDITTNQIKYGDGLTEWNDLPYATTSGSGDGYTGSVGNVGYTGSGSTGYTGSSITGYTGSVGNVGYTGSASNVIGYTGSASTAVGYTGSKGADGGFGGASFDYYYSQAVIDTVPGPGPGDGYIAFNNLSFDSSNIMRISYIDKSSVSVESFLQTVDDSTSAIKGHFSVTDKNNSDVYAIFAITGLHSEHTDHFDIPVAHITGQTTFNDLTEVIVTFARTGDVGDPGPPGYTGSASEVIGYTGSASEVVGYTGSASEIIGYTGSASDVIGYTGSEGVGYTGSASEVIGYTGSASEVIGYTGSASEVVGYTGSASNMAYQGPYNTSNSYPEGSIVTYNGYSFIATTDVPYFTMDDSILPNTVANNAYWDMFASKGRQPFYMRGEWVSGYGYETDDVVFDTSDNHYYIVQGGSYYNTVPPSQQYGGSNSWRRFYITSEIGYTGSASEVIGYTGSEGVGYTGSASEVIGYTGSASEVIGYTGSASEVIGYTGSEGVGYTGSASTEIGYWGSVGYTGSTSTGYTGSRAQEDRLVSNSYSLILNADATTSFPSNTLIAPNGANLTVSGGSGTPIPNGIIFNGSSSYMTIPSSNDWNMGKTWTFEFRIKLNATTFGLGYPLRVFQQAQDNSVLCWIDITLSGGMISILCTASNAIFYTEPTPGEWVHVAVVNNNYDSPKVYYNGILQTYVTGYGGPADWGSTGEITIGKFPNNNYQYFPGSLSSIRISNVPRYTANFTPTTEVFEIDNNLLLLMNVLTGAEYTDSSSYNRTVSHFNTTIGSIPGIGLLPGNVAVNAGGNVWTFGTDGGLTFPNSGTQFLAYPGIGNLSIADQTISGLVTDANITISPAGIGDVVITSNVIPSQSSYFTLGTPDMKWGNVYVGPRSLFIEDITTHLNAEMTVDNSVLYVNGISGLTNGNLFLDKNNLETLVPLVDINIGKVAPAAQGNLVVHRNSVFSKNVTAATFSGDGAGLTNIVNSVTTGTGILQQGQQYGNVSIDTTDVHSVVSDSYSLTVANVTPNSNNLRLTLAQEIGPSDSPTFSNLYVNSNLYVVGNIISAGANALDGKILYLANNSTTSADINGGGIQIGANNAAYARNILYNLTGPHGDYWSTDSDTGFQTEHLNASDVYLSGNLYANGQAHFGGAYSGFNFSNASIQSVGLVNDFEQIVNQNLSDGTNASTDIVATNNLGNDENYFVDMGINGSNYNGTSVDWTVSGANDAYLYNAGGNLTIGTSGTGNIISFHTSGTLAENIRATITDDGLSVAGNIGTTFYTGNGYYLTGLPTLSSIVNINTNLSTLFANAATQENEISGLRANIIVANSAISILQGQVYSNANVAVYLPVYSGNIRANVVTGTTLTFTGISGVQTTPYLGTATNSQIGGVQPDGNTITISNGIISSLNTGFTSNITTQSSTLTVDIASGPSVIFWQPGVAGNRSITLSNFTAGRRIKLFITPKAAPNTFTFTGVTGSQCSNGSNVYQLGGGGSGQNSMIMEIFCTTTSIGGVWIFSYGGV